MHEINPRVLSVVIGGTSSAPVAPVKPLQSPAGMAPPKYSAGWWDLVRASGNFR